MKHWEYKVVDLGSEVGSEGESQVTQQEEEFNCLGQEGWELVAVIPEVYASETEADHGTSNSSKAYFKREKA